MENVTQHQDTQLQDILSTEEELLAPQVICFDAEGKAESVKLKI
jgi:hypothetical protein